MDNWFNVLCLLALIFLNGIFAMSEIALVTSRKARLQMKIDDGNSGAKVALQLNEEPTRALSAIQVGITSIGILSGIVGEAALATPVAEWLNASFGVDPNTARGVGLVLVVVLVTYFSIVLGELVPKRLGQMNPEGIACRIAPPINFLAILMAPFVKLLSVSTDLLLKLTGKKDVEEAAVTEEEIHQMVVEGSEAGTIEVQERDMVRNVFRLDDRTIGTLMTPRNEIEWIDMQDSVEDNIKKLVTSKHSRLPVCDGALDNIKGLCSTRYLLQQIVEAGKVDFTTHMLPVVYVPESLTGLELLDNFKENDVPVAIVVDEVKREDGSLLVDGMMPVPELKDQLNLKTLPNEADGRYNTMAGMIIWMTGHLPKTGDVVTWDNWRFEVVDMDGHRIDKVLVSCIEDKAETEKSEN